MGPPIPGGQTWCRILRGKGWTTTETCVNPALLKISNFCPGGVSSLLPTQAAKKEVMTSPYSLWRTPSRICHTYPTGQWIGAATLDRPDKKLCKTRLIWNLKKMYIKILKDLACWISFERSLKWCCFRHIVSDSREKEAFGTTVGTAHLFFSCKIAVMKDTGSFTLSGSFNTSRPGTATGGDNWWDVHPLD